MSEWPSSPARKVFAALRRNGWEIFFETASAEEIQQRLHEEIYVTQVEIAVGQMEADLTKDYGGHLSRDSANLRLYYACWLRKPFNDLSGL